MIKSSEISKIKKELEKDLDSKRYEHTIAVAYTATSLAMRYDIDLFKAYISGLLHDCAKCISDKKKVSICQKNHISISETEIRNPTLLHAKAGALIASEKYQIDDEDILNAITFHTTGRPGMSDLEKIIFIADYIEPGRNKATNLDLIRKLAFENKEKALLKILEDTLDYLKDSNEDIDITTQQTYEYYKNQLGE